jgi:peptidoglycan/LPS O-acetylase OafA/YrhL
MMNGISPKASGSAHVADVGELSANMSMPHVEVLDGWRGISILLVLAAHLFPIGPKAWQLNFATGVLGMAFFFVLSGFLITSFLLRNQAIREFLARRFFRIVPLAWLYLVFALAVSGASADSWISHLLFYANLPPKHLNPLTDHLWSVCVEMQFYAGIAALVAVCGRRGLIVVPILCIGITLYRVMDEAYVSTITYFRLDEILAGCFLALVCNGCLGSAPLRVVKAVPGWPIVLLLVLSCLRQTEWLNYFRPYFAAVLIGATILNPDSSLAAALKNRILIYIAGISYALYVIHPALSASWLGSGDIIEKYAKRPLLLMVLFVLAHLSTYYYERRWIALGKGLAGSPHPVSR